MQSNYPWFHSYKNINAETSTKLRHPTCLKGHASLINLHVVIHTGAIFLTSEMRIRIRGNTTYISSS